MATHNTYLAYKRDTSRPVYWVIQRSNGIVTTLQPNDAADRVNTSGKTTVSGLLSLCKLIANSAAGSDVPAAVYRLFKSVIRARSSTLQLFDTPDRDGEIEKSNASYKHFIDVLQKAFEVLGGEQWTLGQSAGKLDGTDVDKGAEEDDIEQVLLLSNRFSALNPNSPSQVGAAEGLTGEEEKENDTAAGTKAPLRNRQQRRPGKGKKADSKGGKKSKKTQRKGQCVQAPDDVEDVPLESYRIIEDEEGIMTDYLMAVYALAEDWLELRSYIQETWQDVVYQGLNSAVAGAVSNIAIAMLKGSESAIFVDFPGHDSYETVVKTLTRGDPDKAQGMFSVGLHSMSGPGGEVGEELMKTDVDVREQFLIHTYQDLMDFITDFQKNRSGKPTKAMLAQIADWDPHFNLEQATKEQRIKWRRFYTINWLYDLVNVYSAVVVQHNTIKGQNWDLSQVDWSKQGPWRKHIRLFGLNEFAGFMCSLAWQK
ncbi:hypothetical protein Daus18300_009758 [Diaporthe australafricana]|uniref:DUF6604 domain-containing protein n=1 Tax=Diaporthe australafricana TaxID=127596 RepID=A0ABR3WCS0_9PEZI